MKEKITGVLSPVLTPFETDSSISTDNYLAHCKSLIDKGVGLAVFGTNSEGNSLTLKEKLNLLEVLVGNDLPAHRMMPGTGLCSIQETIELTQQAVRLNCAGALVLPPFYYKGVEDEGLYRFYSQVIEGVGDDRLRLYFYHIPAVSGVPISLGLIERMLKAYPDQIAGIKDSSGSWENMSAMLENFQPEGFDVFAGTETCLLQLMRKGGVGCITATGNVNPSNIFRLYENWQHEDADALQESLNKVRGTFQQFPVIPAMKAALARHTGDDTWGLVRPPLLPLSPEQSAALAAQLDALGFSMDL